MTKAKSSTKSRRRQQKGLGLIWGLLVSTVLGIAIAQWQPQWFDSILPQSVPAPGQRFILASDRLFLPRTPALRPETLPLLDEIARKFPQEPGSHIRILSHARSGQESLNLSYRRAIAVENYLKQQTEPDRFYWFASGVAEPALEDDRIEVAIN